MCETTRKPKVLAHTKDKEVIHQNRVIWHQIYKIHKASNFAMQGGFL